MKPTYTPFNEHGHNKTAGASESDPVWTIQDSMKLYNVQGWGSPYFSINPKGHLQISPLGKPAAVITPKPTTSTVTTEILGNNTASKAVPEKTPKSEELTTPLSANSIDLFELVNDLITRGHSLPVLIRYDDILKDRIALLNEAFERAIQQHKYDNVYRGVFPIKVCQQCNVVDLIVEYGKKYHYGLEAGSKPELLIVLAKLKTPGALITCNGYKDEEYIRLALMGQLLGQMPIVVIEKIYELDIVLRMSRDLKIRPLLGVRAKLASKGSGHWASSTGERAKFGLNPAEIFAVVERLKKENMLDCLRLLHYHIGSQITKIDTIKQGIAEATQFYVQLKSLGAKMDYIDVGGGLGIDYDGSKTSFHASMNYSIDEYASVIVKTINRICQDKKTAVPCIVTESGRAIVSHMTVLVTDTLAATSSRLDTKNLSLVMSSDAKENDVVHRMKELQPKVDAFLRSTTQALKSEDVQELYHDCKTCKDEALQLFTIGILSLSDRAKVEAMYWETCSSILRVAMQLPSVPEELQELSKSMSWTYYCNFSVFQSAPDNWAIGQLFPFMPIHRLDEKPTRLATLADLTCDSDGKIDKFICSGTDDVKNFLEVHTLNPPEPYYIGMFLNGAYQEVLANLHNLYGDTNVVHIRFEEKTQKPTVEHVIKGDTTEEVLKWMQYDPKTLVASIRAQADHAIKSNLMTSIQYKVVVDQYEQSLRTYTYLDRCQ